MSQNLDETQIQKISKNENEKQKPFSIVFYVCIQACTAWLVCVVSLKTMAFFLCKT